MFTVFASCMLFTLYFFLDYVKDIAEAYIGFSTTFSLSLLVEQVLTILVLRKTGIKKREDHWATACWMESDWFGRYSFNEACSIVISFGIVTVWWFTRFWFLNNFIGICLAIVFLKIIQLKQMWPGILLLSLLFIYDIFWVFISPYVFKEGKSVMIAVAMAYDLPNKLVMPAILNSNANTSMLGLGDIVVPGLYLGLMNSFDIKQQTSSYLNTALVGYAISLIVCIGVLIVFDAGQPALLYIVPALFAATYLNGKARGELTLLRNFNANSKND